MEGRLSENLGGERSLGGGGWYLDIWSTKSLLRTHKLRFQPQGGRGVKQMIRSREDSGGISTTRLERFKLADSSDSGRMLPVSPVRRLAMMNSCRQTI